MGSNSAVEVNDRGVDLYNRKQFEEALGCFDKAVELDPNYGKAWCNRANCLFSLNRHQEALNSYRRAVNVAPLAPEIWFSMANVENSIGLSEDAVTSYQTFLALADRQLLKTFVQTAMQYLKELSTKGFGMKNDEAFLWFVKGCRAAWEQRQYDKAMKHFDSAISFFPGFAAAWHHKASCLNRMDRHDEAAQCWKKAGELAPQNAVYWFNLGVMQAQKRAFENASDSYACATGQDPYYIEAWNNRGRVLGMLRRVDEAVECFNRAIELSPSSTVTWWNKALLEDAAGRRGDAALSYSNFVEHALQFPDRYEQQLVHAGKRLDELMPAMPLMPESTAAPEEVGPGKHLAAREPVPAAVEVSDGTAAWSDRAYERLSSGDDDGATECADKALALNSRDELAWINKGAGLYNKAWIDHEAYKYDGVVMNEALSCFNKAIEINPHEPLGFLNKGLCLNDLKKYGEALACFNRALELDPKNAMAWCHKGNSYRASGLYKEAVACCDKAIELALSFPLPWYFKAVSLEELKNESEAISCFRKFLEREPDRNSVLVKDARKRLAAIVGRVIQQSRQ